MNLKRLRKEIDTVDGHLIDLLNKRAEITKRIGRVKAARKAPVYVPDRETEIYRRITAASSGPLSAESLKAVYREIMSGSLRLEKPIEIAYLGPAYTFTHLASMQKFGSSVAYLGCETIKDVFLEVDKGKADYGVVPIENSIDGAINYTLDMFMDSELKICSEVFLEISHHLLSKEKDKARIKKLYSKAEVFAQCRIWLETNMPHVELVPVSSTARAAEIAAKQKNAACIASELAAKPYHLKILESAIQDSVHNVTRFLVIARQDARPTKNDRTSLMFSVKDRVGALHDILVPFRKYGINLTKIESRPSKARAWEYYFFVDLQGHRLDTRVSKMLKDLQKEAAYLKILGSYPVGEGV